MEAVKAWARSIFLLAVFSSTVLLVIPKSMQKQSRFVAEMLLLLCVIAPLGGLVSSGAQSALAPGNGAVAEGEATSFGDFYSSETARRVAEIGQAIGLSIESVDVATKDSGFSLASVVVHLTDRPSDDELASFTEGLSAYLGIGKDKLRVVVRE